MEYRRLGRSGLQVSVVGLGTNNFGGRCDQAAASRVLDQAVESGVNCIDTANAYGAGASEEMIGNWAKGKRDKVILATKFGNQARPGPYGRGASRLHILAEVEASLRRLQTDHIDLYQIHRPDTETPIEETLRTLDDLVKQGKVRYLGSSNFAGWQIAEASWTAKSLGLNPLVSEQPHYNLLRRDVEKEVAPACREYGVGILPFFPLASGLLTGKYRRGEAPPPGTRLSQGTGFSRMEDQRLSDRNLAIVEKLGDFAQERGHTVAQLAIAWLLANPVVGSVIAGATRPEQVVDNVGAAEWRLTAEDVAAVDAIAAAK